MKTQRFIIALLALTFAFAPQLFRTAAAERNPQHVGNTYSARLISPRAGEVLVPGQVFRIQWVSTLPNMDLSNCETELRLSLDRGRTFTWITGERDARVKYFDWTVPNTPTGTAVLDIHFGCLGYYAETSSIQTQSAFVIRSVRE